MLRTRYAIIDAPSILGLRTSGVERLASSLLDNGLAQRLNARYAGRVEPLAQSAARDPDTLILNAQAIAAWSPLLANAVQQVLEVGEFPLILGGDCSILLGSALALKRRGRFGLLFIDGHADFYQPAAEPTGEAASMDLAFATGYGPPLLANLEQRGPLIRPDDTVGFGFRDGEEQVRHGSQPLPSTMLSFELHAVRRMGIANAMATALERLTRKETSGFFVHLDADSLDDRIMPAVDYRLADGFSWDEMHSILATALSSGRAIGLELTIYNPLLDEHGQAGRALTDMLVDALSSG